MNKKQKQMECLYSWAEFYAKNQQWDQYEKYQNQIEQLKNK